MATAIFGRPSVSVASLSADGARATDGTRPPFRSIHDAISSFLDLIDPAIKLIQANVQSKYVGIEPEAVAEQTRLGQLMDDWHLNFEQLMQNERAADTAQLMNGYNVLLSSTISVRVWLEACLSPGRRFETNTKANLKRWCNLQSPLSPIACVFLTNPRSPFLSSLGSSHNFNLSHGNAGGLRFEEKHCNFSARLRSGKLSSTRLMHMLCTRGYEYWRNLL